MSRVQPGKKRLRDKLMLQNDALPDETWEPKTWMLADGWCSNRRCDNITYDVLVRHAPDQAHVCVSCARNSTFV